MTERTRSLLIVGPQGSGKGTQAERIAERSASPRSRPETSSAPLAERHGARTSRSRRSSTRAYYVPDALTSAVVTDRLVEADAADGFLLDGYPRTSTRCTTSTSSSGARRAARRRHPPRRRRARRASRGSSKRALEQGRADDTEEAIRHRQEIYAPRDRAARGGLPRAGPPRSRSTASALLDEVSDRIGSARRPREPAQPTPTSPLRPRTLHGLCAAPRSTSRPPHFGDGRARSRSPPPLWTLFAHRSRRASRPLELDAGIADAVDHRARCASRTSSSFRGYRHTICASR